MLPTLDEIRRRLEDRRLSVVAEAVGINPATLYRFVNGKHVPKYETLKALVDYLNDGK